MTNTVDYPIAQMTEVPGIDPSLRQLMRIPYLQRRVFLRRAQWKPPRFLYKFRALYRRIDPKPGESPFAADSLKRLRVILVDSLLQLSSPDEFNDPFELAASWIIEGTVDERRARYSALVKEQAPHLTFKQREQATHNLMTAPEAQLLAGVEASYKRQRASFGVCCFAAGDPREVLMWSHYASEHTGVCLQFELARDALLFSRAYAVDYVDEYPVINWITGTKPGLGVMFGRKHSRWDHEKERRIIQDDQAGRYLRVDPGALTRIIFGCRADADVFGAIGQLLEQRNARGLPSVALYQAKQNSRRYELDIWRHQVAQTEAVP